MCVIGMSEPVCMIGTSESVLNYKATNPGSNTEESLQLYQKCSPLITH